MKSLGVVVSLTTLSTEYNLFIKEGDFNLYNIGSTHFSVWITTLASPSINFIYFINCNTSSFNFLWWGSNPIYKRHLVSRRKKATRWMNIYGCCAEIWPRREDYASCSIIYL